MVPHPDGDGRGDGASPGCETMTHVPPQDGLPPDIREAIQRALPQEDYVRGVTESGEEYRPVAIPVRVRVTGSRAVP